MAGYGYYEDEDEGGLITGGGRGGLITGGMARKELIKGMNKPRINLISGAGTRSFAVPREGEQYTGLAAYAGPGYSAPRLPSLQWGIKKISRLAAASKRQQKEQEISEALGGKTWKHYMTEAIQKAKQEYLENLKKNAPDLYEKYWINQAKQKLQKERKNKKIEMVRKYLDHVKRKEKDIDKVAEKIKKSLLKEGVNNVKILRAAISYLFPDTDKQTMKSFNFRGTEPNKKPKSVLLERKKTPISAAKKEEIEELAEKLRKLFEGKEARTVIEAIEEAVGEGKEEKEEKEEPEKELLIPKQTEGTRKVKTQAKK